MSKEKGSGEIVHCQEGYNPNKKESNGTIIMMLSKEKESDTMSRTPSFAEAENVAVAVGKKKSSVQAFEWALKTLMTSHTRTLHLLHVLNQLQFIQTPMGPLPFDQANALVQKQARELQSLKTEKLLHVYKKMCENRELNLCVHCIEDDSIQKTLLEQVRKLGIRKLVLGSSSGFKMKWFKKPNISVFLTQNVPDFCAVMVVKNGRLVSVKDATYSSTSKGDFVSECGSYSTSDYEQMKYKALSSSSNSTWQSGEYFTDEHSEHFRFHGEYSFRNLSIGKLHGETEVWTSQAFQSPLVESSSPVQIYNILEASKIMAPLQQQSHSETISFQTSDMLMQGTTQEMVLTEQSEKTEEELCGNIGGEPLEPNKTEHVHGVSNETERRNEVIVAHLNAEIHALRLELAMAKQEAAENRRLYLEVLNNLESEEKNRLISSNP